MCPREKSDALVGSVAAELLSSPLVRAHALDRSLGDVFDLNGEAVIGTLLTRVCSINHLLSYVNRSNNAKSQTPNSTHRNQPKE